MKRMTSLVGKGFQPSKCKTQLRLGSSRIKLLRNKKGIQITADKREVAEFLRNGQESNARLRVEHIIREQNLIEAYDLLYLYAERIAAQLSIIDSQKTCPPDLKEDISTLLYASSRCAELPDFALIRPMFIAKYGKEFVSAIEELRPACGVNARVIEKLSVSRPSGEAKLQLMKDIAAEHNVDWNPAPYEKELRAGPQDLLEGPSKIMSVEDFDDFPTVPSQKPTSERFMEERVEPKDSPRSVDGFRTSLQGGRTGPPARQPPGRSPPRADDPSFDSDMNPGARETRPRRTSRRESDSFAALSRPQEEESRRNSIGVPREKTGRVNTAPVFGGIDEGDLSPPQEYSEHNRRGSIDEFDGSHRAERRQSPKYDGKKKSSDEDEHGGFAKSRPGADAGRRNQEETVSASGKPRSHKQDPDLDEGYYRRVSSREKTRDQEPGEQILTKAPSREGSGKGRTHHEDQYADEQNLRKAPSREGSGKGRTHHEDQYADEQNLKKAPSREGSGKGRTHHEDQYADEQNLKKAPSREGSGKGRTHHEDQYADEQNLRRASSKEGSGKGRTHHEDQYADEQNLRKAAGKEGSGKGRTHHEDQYADEQNLRKAASKEGSGKGRTHHEDQYADEQNLRKAPSREGSGKGRTHHDDQYADEQNLRRASSKEGSGSKIPSSSGEEGRRSKEGSQYPGKYRRHDYSDEDADHVPEPPRRRDFAKIAPKYVDDDVHEPDWDSELFKKSVTTRTPRNPEDEYRDSPRGTRRESLNGKAGFSPRGDFSPRAYDNVRRPHADDTSVKRSNLAVRRKENERSTFETLHYDSSEYEDDLRGQGGGSRKPTSNSHTDRSSESGGEGTYQSRQRTPRLPSVGEQRKDAQEDSSKGRRYGREEPAPRNSRCDDDEPLTASSRAEMRMSLPGGNPKYRSSDAYDDTGRSAGRRATIGPEEITRRARESEDPLPRTEKQKHSDRRQRDDAMEGHQSSSYASPRGRPSGHVDDRPRRFLTPKEDDEYSPRRERPERPRKNPPPRFDNDNPPPRFIKVGKQDDQDSLKPQPTPRSRATLQSHKTDPDLPKTPKAEHRKSQSATEVPPPSKPTFVKPPDLDVFIKMFGDTGAKWK